MRYARARAVCGVLGSVLIGSGGSAVTLAWTPIGDAGNACETRYDPTGFHLCYGAVAYPYAIGTYEVTNAQYAEFLNAKAASDPFQLYNTSMGYPGFHGGITRSGVSESYSYSAIAGRENLPVNYVSYYSAARFANWLNNGQGASDTETGSYTLLGGTRIPSNADTVARNTGATIVLPNEDEWYKAAYYDPLASTYYDYPAGSDTIACAAPASAPNLANCKSIVGDFTPVGSYTGSASPYGTFDQGGNAIEMIEPRYRPTASIIIRGGSYLHHEPSVGAAYWSWGASDGPPSYYGFRLAIIPEPSTGLLVAAGLLGLAGRRRVAA